jgi:hypothetical protein
MSEWASRPIQMPPTGRRKPTHRWCAACETLHRTQRAVGGEESCPALEQAREARRAQLFAGPRISMPPRKAERVVLRGG